MKKNITKEEEKAPRNNENTEEFTMKKHLIDFPENNISIEGFYDRLRPCYDSIMQRFTALWKIQRKAGHRLSAGWSF